MSGESIEITIDAVNDGITEATEYLEITINNAVIGSGETVSVMADPIQVSISDPPGEG